MAVLRRRYAFSKPDSSSSDAASREDSTAISNTGHATIISDKGTTESYQSAAQLPQGDDNCNNARDGIEDKMPIGNDGHTSESHPHLDPTIPMSFQHRLQNRLQDIASLSGEDAEFLTDIWNFVGVAQYVFPDDSLYTGSNVEQSERSERSDDSGYAADVEIEDDEDEEMGGFEEVDEITGIVRWMEEVEVESCVDAERRRRSDAPEPEEVSEDELEVE